MLVGESVLDVVGDLADGLDDGLVGAPPAGVPAVPAAQAGQDRLRLVEAELDEAAAHAARDLRDGLLGGEVGVRQRRVPPVPRRGRGGERAHLARVQGEEDPVHLSSFCDASRRGRR